MDPIYTTGKSLTYSLEGYPQVCNPHLGVLFYHSHKSRIYPNIVKLAVVHQRLQLSYHGAFFLHG